MIDGAAIAAILSRAPGSERLVDRLDRATPPFLVTSVALVEAVLRLVQAKAECPTPALLGQARAAVAEFVTALGLREVPVSADIGRRAMDRAVETGADVSRCFAEAVAAAYRAGLLAADEA